MRNMPDALNYRARYVNPERNKPARAGIWAFRRVVRMIDAPQINPLQESFHGP
jgi:hypothetical protein